MKTKGVIYGRVSTISQSTESQIRDLKTWAEHNNFIIEKVFDESISGFTKDRDELTNLKKYIEDNNIKHILCFELSRLGRSTRQTLDEIGYFTSKGVNLFFKKENLNTLSGSPTMFS
jgi:site-specific DNA recombinase